MIPSAAVSYMYLFACSFLTHLIWFYVYYWTPLFLHISLLTYRIYLALADTEIDIMTHLAHFHILSWTVRTSTNLFSVHFHPAPNLRPRAIPTPG